MPGGLEFSVLHLQCLGLFFALLIFVCIVERVNPGLWTGRFLSKLSRLYFRGGVDEGHP